MNKTIKKYESEKSVGIVILTLNAAKTVNNILEKIDFKRYKVLILDSFSSDNTLEICGRYNCEIKTINKNEFNHGLTREQAYFLTSVAVDLRIGQLVDAGHINVTAIVPLDIFVE